METTTLDVSVTVCEALFAGLEKKRFGLLVDGVTKSGLTTHESEESPKRKSRRGNLRRRRISNGVAVNEQQKEYQLRVCCWHPVVGRDRANGASPTTDVVFVAGPSGLVVLKTNHLTSSSTNNSNNWLDEPIRL